MDLKDQILLDITGALKKKETAKLSILRYLHAQIKDAEIEKRNQKLTDQEVINLINSQIKKLKESLVLFEQGQRQDLVDKTQTEIEILSSYLPKQISDEELDQEIEQISAANPNLPHPGALISLAVKKLAGQADNQRIAQAVNKRLKPTP